MGEATRGLLRATQLQKSWHLAVGWNSLDTKGHISGHTVDLAVLHIHSQLVPSFNQEETQPSLAQGSSRCPQWNFNKNWLSLPFPCNLSTLPAISQPHSDGGPEGRKGHCRVQLFNLFLKRDVKCVGPYLLELEPAGLPAWFGAPS